MLRPQSLVAYRSIFILFLPLRRAQHTLIHLTVLKKPYTLAHEDALYHALCQRLLRFVNIVYHYVTSLVLALCARLASTEWYSPTTSVRPGVP